MPFMKLILNFSREHLMSSYEYLLQTWSVNAQKRDIFKHCAKINNSYFCVYILFITQAHVLIVHSIWRTSCDLFLRP
jgi:hypothetical protein